MRKTLLVLLTLTTLVGFSACSKDDDYYPASSRSIYLTLDQGWIPNDDRTIWSYQLNVPEIDDLIVEYGTVTADISFDGGKTFESLTSVYDQIAYRMEYSVGYVNIEAQSTADNDVITSPGPVVLKLILSDADAAN